MQQQHEIGEVANAGVLTVAAVLEDAVEFLGGVALDVDDLDQNQAKTVEVESFAVAAHQAAALWREMYPPQHA